MREAEIAIRLTLSDLEKALNSFNSKERKDAAAFFIKAIANSPELFEQFPGMISKTSAEIWVADPNDNYRHHISLSTEKEGQVKYQEVNKQGEVLQELFDKKASDIIADVLIDSDALILIDD